ncbi:hypothetical protein BUALT_Bualt19G0010900 [Buddleja alternifolia]|uniref:ADF-H domain-containing protein n=1 Tax=Buddleja alternifolia TaxID=168488 RepID=A0AAV6W4I7_9LAMI|nr:hypothetical protein BUALT_Bualt19G0010900 [Buddleja alternifolia]
MHATGPPPCTTTAAFYNAVAAFYSVVVVASLPNQKSRLCPFANRILLPSRKSNLVSVATLLKIDCVEQGPANAASGIAVSDECKLRFVELKAKRDHRYIVFKIDGGLQQVMVEKVGSHGETYEDFSNSLPADDCRYAVFDYDFTTAENCHKSKIFFFAWSPEIARVRTKMLYASSKDRFKRELDGIQVELQATDPSEMSLDTIKERAY